MYGLKISRKADEISQRIWNEVLTWKYFEKDTIGKQFVRSADSISANLSEAQGRYSYSDRKRFYYYARGSLFETMNWIHKAIERELISKEEGEHLISELNLLKFQLNTLLKNSK
jgi:four helix bundle protein